VCAIVVTMRKYAMVGAPGSGKSTHSRILARDFDLARISVGDIFRWHVRQHTKIGARVREVVAAGRLVADPLVDSVVRDRLDQHDWNHGFVIDGYPRSQCQAEFLLRGYDLDAAVYLDLSDDRIRDRVLGRRRCGRCGMVVQSPSRQEDGCDVCGGPLVTRDDDTAEALAARIHDHHEDIGRVLELLRRKAPVFVVDASRDPGVVQREIRLLLGLHGPGGPAEEGG
jgi:adenylate kinase